MTAPRFVDDHDQLKFVGGFASWREIWGPDCYGLFRPFKNLVFYFFQNTSLTAWHSFHLTIYLCAAASIFALFRTLFASPAWGFLGALLWSSSPTQVSVAAWMSAFNLSLGVVFMCACILTYDRARKTSATNYLLVTASLGLLFLAEISYESAISIPGICILVDIFRKRPIFSRSSVICYLLLGAVTLSYLLLRWHEGATYSVQKINYGFSPDIEPWQLSVSAPWFLWRHFSMWMLPIGRIEFFSTYIWGKSVSTIGLIAASIFLVGLIGVGVSTLKKHPLVSLGIFWFLIAIFPTSNIIPIWSGPITDYYLFYPSVGLSILIVGIVKPLSERILSSNDIQERPSNGKAISLGLLVMVSFWRLSLVPMFWLQAELWNRPVELFLRTETTRPYQYFLQSLAARQLMLNGRLEEAKELAKESFGVGPWNPGSSMLLGKLAFQEGDFASAVKWLSNVLENSPEGSILADYSNLHLAKIYDEQGKGIQIVREHLLPILNAPRSSYKKEAILTLFTAYTRADMTEKAAKVAQNAALLYPNDKDLQSLLQKTVGSSTLDASRSD